MSYDSIVYTIEGKRLSEAKKGGGLKTFHPWLGLLCKNPSTSTHPDLHYLHRESPFKRNNQDTIYVFLVGLVNLSVEIIIMVNAEGDLGFACNGYLGTKKIHV